MKKAILLISLALCATALAGCHVTVTPLDDSSEAVSSEAVSSEAVSSEAAAAEAPAASTPPATEEAAPAGKTIEPLLSALDIKALNDCTFAASFTSSAVAADSDGAPSITMTVYDCDKFDLADVSQLAPGDTIVIEGEEVAITTVEQNDIGIILNGGIEAGGFDLTTKEDGVYIPTTWDGFPVFHTLGEVTLPLDEEFVFTDRSDLEGPELTCNAEAFVTFEQDGENEYMPQATTVTVADGQITAVTLDYMP